VSRNLCSGKSNTKTSQ